MKHPVYFGTILLEPNRWTPGKAPTVRLGDWIGRIAEAGFDGLELWENHAHLFGADEGRAAPLPVAVFNSYAACDAAGAADRQRAGKRASEYGACGIKFNVGADTTLRDAYVTAVRQWLETLPPELSLLCECHPGTVMEEPAAAASCFAAFDSPRVKAIIHPFGKPAGELRAWFGVLGADRIAHAHVQLRDATGTLVRLERHRAEVEETVRILDGEGFRGSFTLEFTEGVGHPPEDVEGLWRNAVDDLNVLRETVQ